MVQNVECARQEESVSEAETLYERVSVFFEITKSQLLIALGKQ